MTDEFLNGYLLTKPSKLFYPFVKRVSSPVAFKRLEYIAVLLAKLPNINKEVCNARKLIDSLRSTKLEPIDLATTISKLYELLKLYIDKFAGHSTETHTATTAARSFNPADYQPGRLGPILALHHYVNENISQYLRGFYLHGSVSTLDFCDYSDVDTLCIVTKTTIDDPASLVALQEHFIAMHRYFYEFDFLQHHGVFVITEYDLEYYPQTYFPLMLFDYSTTVFQQSSELQFKTRDSQAEQINCFWRHAKSIIGTYLTRTFPRNLYAFKMYLSTFMLLPVLYLQAKGIHCYKRSSFEMCRNEFDSAGWAAMDKASSIRDSWQFTPAWLYRCLLKNRVNPMLATRVYTNLVRSVPRCIKEIVNEEFYEQCCSLSESMLRNISKTIQKECST